MCVQKQILKFKVPEIPYIQVSHTGASKLFLVEGTKFIVLWLAGRKFKNHNM